MRKMKLPRFGPEYAARIGTIAEPRESQHFIHSFGGIGWTVLDSQSACPEPSLLLTLDLRDPKLAGLAPNWGCELPLASHLNCDAWTGSQLYQADVERRTLTLIERSISAPQLLMQEDRLPNPLPHRSMALRDMTSDDVPYSEDVYWRLCEEFLNGDSFIRVGGAPVWLQWVEEHYCRCGRVMPYIAGIGAQSETSNILLLDNAPFFFGEGALYFFLCDECRYLLVDSQST